MEREAEWNQMGWGHCAHGAAISSRLFYKFPVKSAPLFSRGAAANAHMSGLTNNLTFSCSQAWMMIDRG